MALGDDLRADQQVDLVLACIAPHEFASAASGPVTVSLVMTAGARLREQRRHLLRQPLDAGAAGGEARPRRRSAGRPAGSAAW